MAKAQVVEKAKRTVRNIANKVEQVLDSVSGHVDGFTGKCKDAFLSLQITQEMIREIGKYVPDMQDMKLYNVHFVEYIDGKKETDVPVFLASSPEWAFGYCKNHTKAAPRDQENSWWYFYVTEMTVNNSDEPENWIACLDWDGKLVTNTYHINKGYGVEYAKDHIIYEQSEDNCEECADNEKDEETKIAERSEIAKNASQELMKKFYGTENTIVQKDGDWYKVWALVPEGRDLKITDMEYAFLHKKFGISAGNRILFYLARKTK